MGAIVLKKSRFLLAIDILTLIFLAVQIQSTLAGLSPEHYGHYPLTEQLYDRQILVMGCGV